MTKRKKIKNEICGYKKKAYSSTRTRMAGKKKQRKKKGGNKKKKKATNSKQSKQLRQVPNNVLVLNYRLRRAERWKDMPSMSSELGEI